MAPPEFQDLLNQIAHSDNDDFLTLIDDLHSLTRIYNKNPIHDWEVNDKVMKSETQSALIKYYNARP